MDKPNLRQIMHPAETVFESFVRPAPLPESALVCYSYDSETFEFVGITWGDESPREPGEVLWPAHTVQISPPNSLPLGQAWVWKETNWVIEEDHRGTVLFDSTGVRHIVDGLGPIPEGLTLEDPRVLLESMDFFIKKYAFRAAMDKAGYHDNYIESRVTEHTIRFWWEETRELNWLEENTQVFLNILGIDSSKIEAIWQAAKDYRA